ncbi:MAG TPA: hypothetical protein VJQ79_01765 [Acidimicrobiia bacterium]|nr:hypothetical protein [Acidimicrobiia bacterium]
MGRWRLVAGVGVVAVLALTLIVLSVRGDSSSSPSTTTLVAVPTTTTRSTPSTTTAVATTQTTTAEQRLAEVEMLLQELWFGWFDAIYRKDQAALWKVVATTTFYKDGMAAMNSMEFIAKPTIQTVLVDEVTILLDRPDCLVVENSIDMTAFRGINGDKTVRVLWPEDPYGFRFATAWLFPNDLWLDDCDNLARETTE